MKVVKPSVELIWSTLNPERVIERFGRICYQSDHKVKPCMSCNGSGQILNTAWKGMSNPCVDCSGTGTDIASAIDLINKIKANGHESVLEHASAGFSIITDRGVTHEIVRHRIASYSQESTRYCDYASDRFGGELTFIEPPGLSDAPTEDAFCGAPGPSTRSAWQMSIAEAANTYKQLRHPACNVPAQIARSVLPNALKSEIGMTANFREWRHFLRLRTSPKAHPQMREVAEMIRTELLGVSKVCFEDLP